MLEAGRGRLLGSGSPKALAESLTELIRNDELRNQLGRRAYEFSRTMVWPEVGARYRLIFERTCAAATRTSVLAGAGGVAEEVGAGLV
jgi:hypothetical protein